MGGSAGTGQGGRRAVGGAGRAQVPGPQAAVHRGSLGEPCGVTPHAQLGSAHPGSSQAHEGASWGPGVCGPSSCGTGVWPVALTQPGEMHYINVNFPANCSLTHSTSDKCSAVTPIFHTLCLCSLSGAILFPWAVAGWQLEKFSFSDADRTTQWAATEGWGTAAGG